MPASTHQYLPISSYGAIGNLYMVALVGLNGSIDWCCFPRMPDPSVFGAILDVDRGGHFQVRATGASDGVQEYVPDTNVIMTLFQASSGQLRVTDFMPISGKIDGCQPGKTPPSSEIHRVLECEGGSVTVEVDWSPRLNYARSETRIEAVSGGFVARDEESSISLCGLPGSKGAINTNGPSPSVKARFSMKAGERLVLITRWDTAETGCRVEDSLDRLQETIASWTEWTCKEEATGSRQWAGRWNKHVIRSELVLKLLTSAQSGGFAAAPTTSLPEEIGGVRNWDYRFCWIRDAALTAQALLAMGHSAEARDLLHWVERVSDPGHERTSDDRLQILYGIDGKQNLEECELSHLEGYRQSKPVRIGNKASVQAQHDIYGEVLSLAYEFARLDEAPSPHLHDLLRITADQAADCWREPDFSIWEPRNGPKHYTYSKAMVWMALDRAEQLASRYGIQGDTARWGREGREVRQYVLDNCFNAEINSFVQFPGTSDIDAALLLLPMMEILPIEDPRIQGTIDAVLRDLTENKMVYRYHTQDGIEGGEGTFVLCTFWLVDALTLSGRLDEARDIFEDLVGHANHVGLLSEQIDARTGELLGNFPQAFSHIGLINSALYLAYAEGREIPVEAPMGTPAHRDCIGRKARSS